MTIWWIENAPRFKQERTEIDKLGARVSWLHNVAWELTTETAFEVNFDILHDGETYPFVLRYPSLFPVTPPLIIPRNGKRISGHQYGGGGELCLEHRPDNWVQSITGADMIESAFRLVSVERNPSGRGEVISAHKTTLGQDLRWKCCRFFLTQAFLKSAQENKSDIIPFRFFESFFEKSGSEGDYVAIITSISTGENEWIDKSIPLTRRKKIFIEDGILIKVDDFNGLPEGASSEDLSSFLVKKGQEGIEQKLQQEKNLKSVALISKEGTCRFAYISRKDGETTLIWYVVISEPLTKARLPEEYSNLTEKSAVIIGCGSLGSKIATSLIRAGIKKIVLVDDDIFMPGNIVRNELDKEAIGQHKTVALKQRLLKINPEAIIETRQIVLGGQEAAGTTSSAIEKISGCDIIIDATANDNSFNFCSAAAQFANKPMAWGEVFAGGIGGMICRSRPQKDPPPQSARRQILAWWEEHGTPLEGVARGYGLEQSDLPPMIADDCDVSIIAAHVAKYSLDILLNDEESSFPNSCYVIGFSNKAIFTQPFDTYPIELTWEPWIKMETPDVEIIKEAMEFAAETLRRKQKG